MKWLPLTLTKGKNKFKFKKGRGEWGPAVAATAVAPHFHLHLSTLIHPLSSIQSHSPTPFYSSTLVCQLSHSTALISLVPYLHLLTLICICPFMLSISLPPLVPIPPLAHLCLFTSTHLCLFLFVPVCMASICTT